LKVTVSETKANTKLLEVEVPAERVESALQAACVKYQKKAQLPGFRKGKVPLSLVRARFGRAIEGEVIDDLISETYEDAQKQEGINPAGAAKVEGVEYEPGKPLRYKASVEVMPEVTLKEYRGIHVTREVPRITEEDVEAALESLRDHYAEVATVEDAAREGHFVVADVQAVDRIGVPIVGDKVENADFQLGQSPFGPEFDEQLVGTRRGEERVVTIVEQSDALNVTAPARERSFSVKIKEIKEKSLPDLDDELAQTAGGLATLEELRQKVREDLVRNAELEAKRNVRDQIADHLTKENPIPVPEGLVSRFVDSLVADLKGTSEEPLDEEELRMKYWPLARNHIRLHLILEEIGRREQIEGKDEEILDYLAARAQISEVEPIRKEDYPSLIIER